MREIERTRRMITAAAVQLRSPSALAVEQAMELLAVAVRRANALAGAMREGAIPLREAERERAADAWRRLRLEARRAGLLVAQLRDHAAERLGACGYDADGVSTVSSGTEAGRRWSVRV